MKLTSTPFVCHHSFSLYSYSDNDKSRLACGTVDTFDVLVCAGKVAATKAMEFFECFVGEDLKCVKELAEETIKCASNFKNCVFTVDDCLSFEFDETLEGNLYVEKAFRRNACSNYGKY